MQTLRQRAEEWLIHTDEIIVMSFSAGGHLAASYACFWSGNLISNALECDALMLRPNGLILGYPVITSGEYAHRNSFVFLLGERYDELVEKMSLEKQVNFQNPPTFIWHTVTDEAVPVENSKLFAEALQEKDIPVELHLYPEGMHGLALANELTAVNDQWIVPSCQDWVEKAQKWMKNIFYIRGGNLMKCLEKIFACLLILTMLPITACQFPQETDYRLVVDQDVFTLFVGEECNVVASAYCEDILVEEPTLLWESGDNAVATVENGRIRAVGFGQTRITAKYEDARAEILVRCMKEISAEEVNAFDESYINIFGRSYTVDDGLRLDQTANAVEVGIIGTCLSVSLTANNSGFMQVFCDGENIGRIENSNGTNTYQVAENLTDGYHIIRIVKDTEMQYAQWTLHSFDAEKFATVPERSELKIEFVGDSLTAGYGALGRMGEAWSVRNSAAIEAFAYKTAKLLSADFSIVAWSGICTRAYMWSDTNMATLYDFYSSSNTERYPFTEEPDVIVINLGTNDASYITGKDKSYEDKFFDDYLEFLTSVRKHNPNAYIICLYGFVGEHPVITEGIQMATTLMDNKVIFNPFEFIPNASGANGHPAKDAHSQWAESLAEYIENLELAK